MNQASDKKEVDKCTVIETTEPKKTTREITTTGNPANTYTESLATNIENEGKVKSEGWKRFIEIAVSFVEKNIKPILLTGLVMYIWRDKDEKKNTSDTSTTPASGGAVTTDVKVPGNDNIPGNGGGAA